MIQVLGIDNILFDVGDLVIAREFYGVVLGLPVKFAARNLIAFYLGDSEPALLVREAAVDMAAPRATPRIWLEVPDAVVAADALLQAGAEPLEPPFEVATGWTVEIADPWGNVIGLTDYVKRPDLGRHRVSD